MKTGRWLLAVAIMVVPALASAALFHAGWTGSCDGCHSQSAAAGGPNYSEPTEICLRCHSALKPKDHQVVTVPVPPRGIPPMAMTPGGDFAYQCKDYFWTDETGAGEVSPGERHAHNVVASSYGLFADTTLVTSPGGVYRSNALSCISCHDPHGNYRLVDLAGTITTSGHPIADSGSYGTAPTATEAVGTFRMLAGKGYKPKAVTEPFKNDPPIAVSPRDYNRRETFSDTRVAYGRGVSEWCANCHGGFLTQANNNAHLHPAGVKLGAVIANTYNQYLKTGDVTGSRAGAFTSLVPFQHGDLTDVGELANLTKSTAGPDPDDKVMCLTCHRAHASGWDGITRWNTRGSLLTIDGDYPGLDAANRPANGANATGKTREEYRIALYDRGPSRFSAYQRSLCNKCHDKD